MTRAGLFALAFPTFGPERRGAPMAAFTKISDRKIQDRSEVRKPNVVVVLDHTLWGAAVLAGTDASGLALVNVPAGHELEPLGAARLVTFDAGALAERHLGRRIANTAILGVLAALVEGVPFQALHAAVEQEFKPSLRQKNLTLLDAAYRSFEHG